MIERELTLFPEDETGNMLWQLLNEGVDLNQPVEIEFSMVFPTQQQALNFGHILLENNQKISFSPYDAHATHKWEITAYPPMSLTYQNILGYQQLLESHSEDYSGIFDGWYCASASEF